jgi:hypothetical protein
MQHQKIFMIFVLIGSFFLVSFDFFSDAHAQTKITVLNGDDPGEGFNDASPPDPASTAGGNTGATLGEQRFKAFEFAADIWAQIIESSVEIEVGANFDPLDCGAFSAVLGSAGPNTVHRTVPGAPQPLVWYPQALANSFAEEDLAPIFSDIGANFNSAIGTTCPFPSVWYYGLDRDPPEDTIDFVTVVLHELGHGLGFLTFVNLITGEKLELGDDTFMLNLEDHTTGKLYPDMTNEERRKASRNTGNLHWVGANVIAASTGLVAGRHEPSGHVEMYAPFIPAPGSSVSHFSESLFPNELMEPFFSGVDHEPGLATALMKDIGWAASDAPPEQDEIIGTWDSGTWYWDVAASEYTEMSSDTTREDIAAGDFTADGIADVAAILDNGLWYLNGATLEWTLVDNSPPFSVTAGDVTRDGRAEIIGSWDDGIRYWDVAESKYTLLASSTPSGDIAAGDFTRDGIADVAAIYDSGLWYLDGVTLDWTQVGNSPPFSVTAGDVTGK